MNNPTIYRRIPGYYPSAASICGPGKGTAMFKGHVRMPFQLRKFLAAIRHFGIVSVLLLTASAAGPQQFAIAQILIDGGPSSTLQLFGTGNYVAGTEFTINSPLVIRSLGWLDAEGDGLVTSHRVGLWTTPSQELLSSAVVTPDSPSIVSTQGSARWFLEDVTPIKIEPGAYRVAGLVSSGDNIALGGDKISLNGITLSPGYIRNLYPAGGFGFPVLTHLTEAIWATIVGEIIPEPSTLALVAIGCAAIWHRRRL